MSRNGMLLATAVLSTAAAAADTTAYSKLVKVGPEDRIRITNVSGSLDIATWDRNEVEIQGQLASGIERVDVTQENGGLEIRVVVKDGLWKDDSWSDESWKRSEANLRVRLPAGTRLDANVVSASLTVAGVRGKTRLKSVSGDIESDLVSTDLEAKSVSGDIELEGNGTSTRVQVNSVSGDVTLEKVGGEIQAKSVSGDVEVALQAADDVRASTVSGNVDVTGSLASKGELDVQSVSGRARIIAKAPAGYYYELSSFSGRIKSCFGQAERSDGNRSSRLTGTQGAGDGSVRVKSHSGSVEVCDH